MSNYHLTEVDIRAFLRSIDEVRTLPPSPPTISSKTPLRSFRAYNCFFPERDHVTLEYMKLQIRLSSSVVCNVSAPYSAG